MKIQLTINGRVLSATLENSVAAKDFATLLPLQLRLDDYAGIEKISELPKKLAIAGAAKGMTMQTVSQFWDWLDRNDDSAFTALYNAMRDTASPALAAEMDKHMDYLSGAWDAAASKSEVNFGA